MAEKSALTPAPSKEEKGGFFSKIGQELSMFGKTLSKEAGNVSDKINQVAAEKASGPILNLFQAGNKIQLVSRASGKTLQIVNGPQGLAVDGLGGEGVEAPNAVWMVINEGSNQVRLHNNNNFIAIIDGATSVKSMPEGSAHGNETKFQLIKIQDQFVALESFAERKRHVGIMPTGELKPALATGHEDHGQFAVRVVY